MFGRRSAERDLKKELGTEWVVRGLAAESIDRKPHAEARLETYEGL